MHVRASEVPSEFAQWNLWLRHKRSRSHAGDQSDVFPDRRASVQHLPTTFHHTQSEFGALAKKADSMKCFAGGIRISSLVFLGYLRQSKAPQITLPAKAQYHFCASILLESRKINRRGYSIPKPKCSKDQQQCGCKQKSLRNIKTEELAQYFENYACMLNCQSDHAQSHTPPM